MNKLFIVAGEPSGDVIGADFLRRLPAIRSCEAIGVGGTELKQAGLHSIFPMEQLSVMGFVDVALRLPLLLFRIEQTVRRIIREKPDLVLLIDSQVFSQMVAKKLRRRGYVKPIVLYVAPAVWAWKPERAPKLKALYDEILSVLPFEPEVMARLGGPTTTYVGHPATDRIQQQNVFCKNLTASGDVVLLPGSRHGELKRHLPVFQRFAETVIRHPRVTGFAIPTLPHLVAYLRNEVSTWQVPVEVVSDSEARKLRTQNCIAALASAGTITLELALTNVLHIGTYVPDRWQMKAFEKADKPLVSLANNVLGQEIFPEIFPGAGFEQRLVEAFTPLLEDEAAVVVQNNAFADIRKDMSEGITGVGKFDAVDRILNYLPNV